MNNTFQVLINWDRGNTFAERMSAKLLGLEGYTNIDPQCPNGGPDGTKDILCQKNANSFVVGCYFPTEQKGIKDIEEKLSGDYEGVAKHSADGFVFITNQKITPGERVSLSSKHSNTEIYHGERVCNLLDSPSGYGVRLEYLGIALTKEEQISFLDQHLNLESRFEELNEKIDLLSKATNAVEGLILDRDVDPKTKVRGMVFPIAGIPTISRLSIEDVFTIHTSCMYDEPNRGKDGWGVYRKTEVWVGRPGCSKENADFLPVEPSKIPDLIHELVTWWRDNFEKALYGEESFQLAIACEFHARLLEIHPFIDGNGRVARILTSMQCEEMFGKKIKFEKIDSWDVYYSALMDAQQNKNYCSLATCLKAIIE